MLRMMMVTTPRSRLAWGLALGSALWLAAAGCGGDGDAEVEECEPVDSCDCTDNSDDRQLLCTCTGGSMCSINGDDIEFQCEGNAACGLTCGENCLITCPGTTSCTVDTGNGGDVTCPGTAICDITCRGDCTVTVDGTADALVTCEDFDSGATCDVSGNCMDCGDGITACGGTECPSSTTDGGV